MPFTKEFLRIRDNYRNKYKDRARAETFAYKKAFKEKIPTWKEEERKIKRQNKKNIFWPANTLYILLLFVVVFVIMAAFMPAMRDMIAEGVSQVSAGEGGTLLSLLFYAVPILLILMALYAILVLVANR